MKQILTIFFISSIFITCSEKSKTNIVTLSKPVGWGYGEGLSDQFVDPIIPNDTVILNLTESDRDNPNFLQGAIDGLHQNGGGTLVIPNGKYIINPLQLKSHINLHLSDSAELILTSNAENIPLVYTWWGGIPCLNYSPMIYGYRASDIKISGNGKINGRGRDQIWMKMERGEDIDWEILKELEDENVDYLNRKFGKGHSLRPDLIGLVECERVNISGVKLINSPYWSIHPIMCSDLKVTDCFIGNQDKDKIGIAVESTKNVLIENVDFKSLGDGIKILSGRVDIEGEFPSRDIIIRDCEFNGITYSPLIISSNTREGAYNIFAERLKVDTTEMLFRAFGNRYQPIHDIYLRNSEVNYATKSVLYSRVSNGSKGISKLYNVFINEIKSANSGRSFVINGHKKNPIQKFSISNCNLNPLKRSFANNVIELDLVDLKENENKVTGSFTFENEKMPEISFNKPEEDVLDSDDIQIHKLPEPVVKTLQNDFPQATVLDIDRKITSSNVIYEINLETMLDKEQDLIILIDGTVIQSSLEITFSELPEFVVNSLEDHLGFEIHPLMINDLTKVNSHDLVFYEIIGEINTKLFAVSITESGNLIESKHKLLKNIFLQSP